MGASGLSQDQTSLLYRASNDTWYSISPTPMVRLITDIDIGIAERNDVGLLLHARPNPADAQTVVSFALNKGVHAQLDLFDINGRPVRTLASGRMAAGTHEVDVDTRSLASGVYNCTLRTVEGVTTRRLVVMH